MDIYIITNTLDECPFQFLHRLLVIPYFKSLNSIPLQQFAANMQLLLLLSFVFFTLTLGSPADILNIQKVIADESHLVDSKNFAELVNIFYRQCHL